MPEMPKMIWSHPVTRRIGRANDNAADNSPDHNSEAAMRDEEHPLNGPHPTD